MEIEKPSFEKDLWGQCNKLHERLGKKIDYYKNLRKSLEPIHSSLTDLNKKLNSTKISMDPTIPIELYNDSKTPHSSSVELDIKFYGVPLTMKTIIEFITNSVDFNLQTLFNVVNNLEKLINKMKQEKNEYEELQKSLSSLSDSKKIMEKNMKEYHKKMWAAEQSVLDMNKIQYNQMAITDDTTIIESKEMIETKAVQLVGDAVKPYKIYEESVKKANKIREESIIKQKHLLFTYQDIEEETGRINITISNIFFSNLKFQNEFIEEKKNETENIRNNINIKKEVKQLIIDYTGNEKPEEIIPFVNFPSVIDFDKCDEDKDFNINTSTIEFIQDLVKGEFPNYDKGREEKKNEMRIVTYALFNKYSSENEKKLLKYIEDVETHNYFLILLSKLRTNNRFEQSNQLIDLLGEILNKILNMAEEYKNYENAKNCIILSQTFYYEKNNEKFYLIEKIRKHKWLLTSDFWFNFIDIMISKELDKFLANHPETSKNEILNNSDEVSEKLKSKISELLFSQMLPYVNNMTEFKLPLKTIVEIAETFYQKYNYLSDEHKESIYGMISNNREEIEKLRKEYKKNNANKLLNNNKVTINNKSNNSKKTPVSNPNHKINSKEKNDINNSTNKTTNNNIHNNQNNKIHNNPNNKSHNNPNNKIMPIPNKNDIISDNKNKNVNKTDNNKSFISNKINDTNNDIAVRSQTIAPFNNNNLNQNKINIEANNNSFMKPKENEKKKEYNFFKKLFNLNQNKKEEKIEEKKENKKEEKKENKKEEKKENKKEEKKDNKIEEKKENKIEENKENKNEIKSEVKPMQREHLIKIDSIMEKRAAILSKMKNSHMTKYNNTNNANNANNKNNTNNINNKNNANNTNNTNNKNNANNTNNKNNKNNINNINNNSSSSNAQGGFLGINLKKVGTIK